MAMSKIKRLFPFGPNLLSRMEASYVTMQNSKRLRSRVTKCPKVLRLEYLYVIFASGQRDLRARDIPDAWLDLVGLQCHGC